MKKISTSEIIEKMCDIPERQLLGETKALAIISSYLVESKTLFQRQNYTTFIPQYKNWFLKVDNKTIPCLPSGLVGGAIQSNYSLLSSLISSQSNLYQPNINFNPSSKSISRSNHYFAPALSISRDHVGIVACATKINGFLEVEKTKHVSANILVGNQKNPKNIVFSHYDSIQTGAVDNAAGTALSVKLIIENPNLLKDTLFVLCGNEELSFDQPIYWGHGYRVFEKKYDSLLRSAKKILILDSFGHSAPQIITDPRVVILGFPIKKIQKYQKKIQMISGSLQELMRIYHTDDDIPTAVRDVHMKQAEKLTLSIIT
jgi:hypothetical protein